LKALIRNHAIYLFQDCGLLLPFLEDPFKCSCKIWGLLAEEGLWELIFVACRSDANCDLRTGIEWEKTIV
jgi:hypothetical protein